MATKFCKEAIKVLQKVAPEDYVRIQSQLNQILITVEEQGIIPFTSLDIKKMKGTWEGFYRLRVGKIRVIFTISSDTDDIEVYTIGVRGDVYK